MALGNECDSLSIPYLEWEIGRYCFGEGRDKVTVQGVFPCEQVLFGIVRDLSSGLLQ